MPSKDIYISIPEICNCYLIWKKLCRYVTLV
jgi:hypothetical protein